MKTASTLLMWLAGRKTWLVPLTIFVGTAALYIRTAAPTLGGGWDSEEFQHVAYTLGISHATGYPLYLILGKLFSTLVPLGNVAYRMNLLSAFIGAGAAVLVYVNALRLTRRTLAALVTAALLATNPAVWRQSGVASVGPLNLFLIGALLYALLAWHADHADDAGPSRPPSGSRTAPTLAAFIVGLILTHHRSTLVLVPVVAVFILLVDPAILRRPRDWVRVGFWGALPPLLYLYMPLFGSNSPWYNNTWEGFVRHLTGGGYPEGFYRATLVGILEGCAAISQFLFESFGYAGLMLVLFGLVSSFPRKGFFALRRFGSAGPSQSALQSSVLLSIGLGTLGLYLATTIFGGGEPDRYLVLPLAFMVYWFALGAGNLEQLVAGIVARFREAKPPISSRGLAFLSQAGLVALFAALLILPFGDRFRVADWSTFDRVYKQWDEIFTLPIPRGAVLVGNWGQLNAMRYMQRVENRRPDLQFVGTLYDPGPQTEAVQSAFEEGRAIYMAPGIALPLGTYRYGLLGPLLLVHNAPHTEPVQTSLPSDVAVNPSLSLYGYGVSTALEPYAPTQTIAPSRTARIALTWRADGAVKEFLVRIGLYDPEGRLVAQRDEPPVRGLYPASQWQSGEYIEDVHNFLIPAGSPPGSYTWQVSAIDANTKAPVKDHLAGGRLAIERATNLTRDQVFVQHTLESLKFDRRLALWGYGGFDGTRRPGEQMTINLLWGVREKVGHDLQVLIVLTDANGQVAQRWQLAPIGYYPTREWQAGEVLKAYYDLRLAENLTAGEFSLAVGLDSLPPAPIGRVQIRP